VDFDHGLNKAINKIREALGDSAESPHFVETVSRRGYRFLAKVKDADAAPVSALEVAVKPHDPQAAEEALDRSTLPRKVAEVKSLSLLRA
jgi:DNA-binding winged helix-turn-helix (wHTH) protein